MLTGTKPGKALKIIMRIVALTLRALTWLECRCLYSKIMHCKEKNGLEGSPGSQCLETVKAGHVKFDGKLAYSSRDRAEKK